MATTNLLTDRFVKSVKEPGRYRDGPGLYLNVGKGRRWVLLFTLNGRSREMGLGSADTVDLKSVREKAREARLLLNQGIDPIEEGKRRKVKGFTFGEVLDGFMATKGAAFTNEKHRKQWTSTIDQYAPKLKTRPVADITPGEVLEVLKPIWTTKPETAGRVRQRIEAVLDAAKAQGMRTGENPASWKGNLAHLLPTRGKLTRGHHTALPFDKAPAFITALRSRDGVAAMALEFTILTAARTSETLGAKWSEFDLTKGLWTVPAVRMKRKIEHRVPLSDRAIVILKEMELLQAEFVFPGPGDKPHLSNAAMDAVLKRMKVAVTVHGFRSTFRDWAGETTGFPREDVEVALSHKVGSAVERAYRRGDALEKRRSLMAAWADYLHPITNP
jgi:integrase